MLTLAQTVERMPATPLIQTLDRDKVTQVSTEASVLLTWETGIYRFRWQSGNDFWLLKNQQSSPDRWFPVRLLGRRRPIQCKVRESAPRATRFMCTFKKIRWLW